MSDLTIIYRYRDAGGNMSIPKYMHTEQKITISSWGMIDDLILYPSDVLVLGEPQDGDLLLVEKMQSSSQRFARFYDGTLIAEPQRAVLSTQIWNIVGAVKAIQRPLNRASLGTKKWWIRVIGREDDSSLDEEEPDSSSPEPDDDSGAGGFFALVAAGAAAFLAGGGRLTSSSEELLSDSSLLDEDCGGGGFLPAATGLPFACWG